LPTILPILNMVYGHENIPKTVLVGSELGSISGFFMKQV
jgi:hypothetical protein